MEVTKKLSDFFSKERVDEVLSLITNSNRITIAEASYGGIANLKTVEDVVEKFDLDNCKDDTLCQEFCFNYMKAASDYNVPIIGIITEIKNLFKLHENDFDVMNLFNILIANEKKEDEELINMPIVTTSEEVDPEEQKLPTMVQGPVAAQRNLPPSAITTHMIKHSKCGCGNPNCDADHGVRARNTAPAPEQSNSDDVKQLQEKANDLKKIVTFTVSTGKLINTSTVDILLRVLKGQTLRNELVSRGLLINGGEVCGLVETVPPTQYYDPVQFPYSFIIQGINGQSAIIQLGGRPILNNGQYIDIYRII